LEEEHERTSRKRLSQMPQGGESVVTFSTGIAAISAILTTPAGSGGHVIAWRGSGGKHQII